MRARRGPRGARREVRLVITGPRPGNRGVTGKARGYILPVAPHAENIVRRRNDKELQA